MPQRRARAARNGGTLIIIGGREDKAGEMEILRQVRERIGNGKLVIATVASTVGEELWEEYRALFRKLGVKKISHLDVVNRKEAVDQQALRAVEGASAVFFTGGDQLKITSELGGTLVAEKIFEIYERGGVIAGTSAGASVMSETMLVSGTADGTYRVGGSSLRMAPGLGFVREMIIDQHFAERGRVSRLLGAVAQNPKYLGVGIDENTAVILREDRHFEVIGAGAVYVIDAHEATDSNISDADQETALSIFNVRMHVLSAGDAYDFVLKKPYRTPRPLTTKSVPERRDAPPTAPLHAKGKAKGKKVGGSGKYLQ